MDEQTDTVLIGLDLDTAVAKTENVQTIKKMIAGDKGLLVELSSKSRVARTTADDRATERLIISRVLRTIRGNFLS